jgi:hypothetical protein
MQLIRGEPDNRAKPMAVRTKLMPEDLVKSTKGLIGCSGVKEMMVFRFNADRNGT